MTRSFSIGLLVGCLTGAWMWVEYALGLHTTYHDVGRFSGALSIIVPIVGVVVALRAVRAEQGRLGWVLAMRHGAVLSAAAAVAMAVMALLYALWLNPAWTARMPGSTAAGFAIQAGVASFVGGLVLSAVVGWILARRTGVQALS